MKKYVFGILIGLLSFGAQATTTLEKNVVECTISSENKFEEIILKFVQTQDADNNIYADYVLDYTYGDMFGESVDILGRYEQVRERIFTSAMADADGVVAVGARDYQMITEFDRSQVIVNLLFEGYDQDNFPTYVLSLNGNGPVFELVQDRMQAILADSEHYNRFDNPLCISHFDLDEFITR